VPDEELTPDASVSAAPVTDAPAGTAHTSAAPRPVRREVWFVLWLVLSAAGVWAALHLPGWLGMAQWNVTVSPASTGSHLILISHVNGVVVPVEFIDAVAAVIVAALLAAGIGAAWRWRWRHNSEPPATHVDGSRRGYRSLVAANELVVLTGLVDFVVARIVDHGAFWRTAVGFEFNSLPAVDAAKVVQFVPPITWRAGTVNTYAAWALVGGAVLTALLVRFGLSRLQRRRSSASKVVPFAIVAAVMSVVVAAVERLQVRDVQLYFVVRHPTTYTAVVQMANKTVREIAHRYPAIDQGFIHSGYGALMVGLGALFAVEWLAIAVMSLDLAWLGLRRRVSSRNWLPVLLVADLAVSVALGMLVATAVTQVWSG
jgi:hypothetical protein